MSEWYENSFGEDYLLVYKHRDMQGAQHEVHKMVDWLKLSSGSQVLDLCCGMGRHSLALADAGYQVTGVDLSNVLLKEAKALDVENHVHWIKSDMRRLPLEDQCYEAVVNLFTSFGYFEDDVEHVKVLQEIYRVLQPGGRYIIDYLNPSYVTNHLVSNSERVDEGEQIIETRSIENNYVKKNIVITKQDDNDNSPRKYVERIKLYSKGQFEQLLMKANLRVDHVYGGYDAEQYDAASSARMIFVGARE